MKRTGLYEAALDSIDPEKVLRTEAQPNLLRRRNSTEELSSVPTNKEILDAAKRHYSANSDTVDLSTLNGQSYVLTSNGHVRVADLNAYDWDSRQPDPIAPTCRAVGASPVMSPAVSAIEANGQVATLVIGISESAQIIAGEEGGIGVAISSGGTQSVAGVVYVAGKIGFDIDVAVNLQVGLWASDIHGLGGDFVGLEVNLDLDVGVSLGVFMHPKDLSFYGFAIGLGVGVGGGATIVGGYTLVFPDNG